MFSSGPGVLAVTTRLSAEAGRPYHDTLHVYVIKLSKSATSLTPGQYIELSESYVTLARKTKYVLRNLRSGGWSPFKTCIIVLSTPQGVSLFAVSLHSKELSDCGYTWALISCPDMLIFLNAFPADGT